ncbi:hypothetical protein C8T65DRAFT_638787, partial [Cerioporus squamosus]
VDTYSIEVGNELRARLAGRCKYLDDYHRRPSAQNRQKLRLRGTFVTLSREIGDGNGQTTHISRTQVDCNDQ